jgi:hypothetical protein
MATFPVLKTQAVAQYPAQRAMVFRNQAVRFLDGTEQRYRDSAGPLRRWVIRLDELDEREMAAIGSFFEQNQGSFASFAFVDPWDGTVHGSCSVAADGLELQSKDEMRGATSLTIVEHR